MKRLKLALLGGNVSDSESPAIHTFILSALGYACDYECVSVSAEGVPAAAERLLQKTDGFNVTVPYKKTIIPYLDSLSEEAAAFDSVNTVAKMKGYNTDGAGFLANARRGGDRGEGEAGARIGRGRLGKEQRGGAFGRGRAGMAVSAAKGTSEGGLPRAGRGRGGRPRKRGVRYSRQLYGSGHARQRRRSPVRASAFGGCSAAVDLIYSPAESEFLRLAKAAGKRTLNGRAMLFYQAYFSDCIYLERKADAAEADLLCGRYLKA